MHVDLATLVDDLMAIVSSKDINLHPSLKELLEIAAEELEGYLNLLEELDELKKTVLDLPSATEE